MTWDTEDKVIALILITLLLTALGAILGARLSDNQARIDCEQHKRGIYLERSGLCLKKESTL